jgi:serine/threonine protein kinase
MEFFDAGSIGDLLTGNKKSLTEDQIGSILVQTLPGLSYLHKLNKIHRDVKAGNLLLNKQGKVKLADFGKTKYSPHLSFFFFFGFSFFPCIVRFPSVLLYSALQTSPFTLLSHPFCVSFPFCFQVFVQLWINLKRGKHKWAHPFGWLQN